MKSHTRATPIKIGVANGQYAFKPDFDKKFDEMDAEIAEEFDEKDDEIAGGRHRDVPPSMQYNAACFEVLYHG